MKRIIIPDIHCKIEWVKNIINGESPDTIIMLGDYFDSFNSDLVYKSDEAFKELLTIKNDFINNHNSNSFIMLLGNHDYHYLSDAIFEQYSGFAWFMERCITPLVDAEFKQGKLPVIYIDDINKIIFSHAGVTKTWMKENNINSIYDINKSVLQNPSILRFTYLYGGNEYGDSIASSPIWVRPNSLLEDKISKYIQIVGHTQSITQNDNGYYEKNNCYFIDNAQHTYMIQELNEFGKIINQEIKCQKIQILKSKSILLKNFSNIQNIL